MSEQADAIKGLDSANTTQPQESATNLLNELAPRQQTDRATQTSVQLAGYQDDLAVPESALGRRAVALSEGLSLMPHGMYKAAVHLYHNPDELAGKAALGAAMGIASRVLLPRAGAAKALVGTVMGYWFVKDAATPLVETWHAAGEARTMDDLHRAARITGDGLGHFAVDAGLGLVTGAVGEIGTGAMLQRSVRGRAFEAAKDDFFSTDSNAIGRFFKWSERTADNTTTSIANKLDPTMEQQRLQLSLEEKIRKINESNRHHHALFNEEGDLAITVDGLTQHKRRYKSPDFQDRIDEALGVRRTEGTQAAGQLAPEGANIPGAATPDLPQQRQFIHRDGHNGHRHTGDNPDNLVPPRPLAGEEPIVVTDAAIRATDGTAPPGDPHPEMAGNVVGRMATTMRAAAAETSQTDMKLMAAKEDIMAPLESTMRSGNAPLDQGHFSNNVMLIELTKQIKTVDDYRQVGMILDHFKGANVQVELAASPSGRRLYAIVDLNQYSRSIHANLLSRFDQLGIPRQAVRGENSPLFTFRDSNGAGPYTIPAIKGVSDAAVVVVPREYMPFIQVHIAGVHPHEMGHNLIYGDLLKFSANLRDLILTDDVVKASMRRHNIADVDMEIPGHGTMKKSEFIVQVLKAQANENTADIFGSTIDPNTGLSLVHLLAELRRPGEGMPKNAPGQLENRSMYGRELVDTEMGNMLGIEPHGIDASRIDIAIWTMRHLAPNDRRVHDYTNGLQRLKDQMSRPGDDYIWASLDEQGQAIRLPRREWDAIIPDLVKAQLDTPLPALNNHTLRDIAPNMSQTFARVDDLASKMADAALRGETTVPGFDKPSHRIEEVFSAGLSGWAKAIQRAPQEGQPGHVPARDLLDRIGVISESLRAHYRNDVPEASLRGPSEPVTFARIRDLAMVPIHGAARLTSRAIAMQPRVREATASMQTGVSAYASYQWFEQLIEQQRLKEQMNAEFNQRAQVPPPPEAHTQRPQ